MIKRTYNLGAIRININIADGIAVLTTNNPKVTKQIYNNSIKNNKNVSWEKKQNAMIEKFKDVGKEEIVLRLDKDFDTALKEQKKASIWAGRKK